MEGLIRKIIIGTDPKNGMAYYVGMPLRDGSKVSAISLDQEKLHRYAMRRYLIYVNADGNNKIWKAVDEMPCVIEYDLNF